MSLFPLWLPAAVAGATLAATVPCDEKTAETPLPRGLSTLWWGDFDADGLADAWAVQPDGSGRLLRNDGDGNFIDVTERVGLDAVRGPHMAAFADANGDGRLDLYLPAWRGESRLFVQTEDGSFVDETDAAGLPRHAEPIDAKWLDLDGNGHLDLHLVTEIDDLVYRGDGRGRFEKADLGLAPRLDVGARAESVDEARASRGLGPVGPGSGDANGPGAPGNLGFEAVCAIGIQDQATPSDCMQADSVPTLGRLYPISSLLFATDSNGGRVGVGTTSPGFKLEVLGTIRSSGNVRAIQGVFSGDPPMAVAGSSVVSNLNADMLDGVHASAFAQLPVTGGDVLDGTLTSADLGSSSVGTAEIADGSIVDADVNAGAAIQGAKIVPNFGTQTVLTNGAMSVGPTLPNAKLHVNGQTGVDPLRVQADSITRLFVQGGTGNVAIGGFFDPATELDVRGHLNVSQTAMGGRAVEGFASSPNGTTYGGIFFSSGSSGCGVYAGAASATGTTYGVYGASSSTGGRGVYGLANATNGGTYGVFGHAVSTTGRGVIGYNSSTSANSQAIGVQGQTANPSGYAVWGVSTSTTGVNIGVGGQSNSGSGWGGFFFGRLGATGTKSFVHPHASDPSKEIRFVCLEGNEAGTYFRGSSRVTDGTAVINVPEEFRMVSREEGLTVQLTAVGSPARLWVESQDLERIVVRSDLDTDFHYFVNGVRHGYHDFEVVADALAYVPRYRGVPFGTQYPKDVQQRLIDTGILNPDLTPNEDTAAALGWTLLDAEAHELQQVEEAPTPVLKGAREAPDLNLPDPPRWR